MKVKAWRYSYRSACSTEMGPWHLLNRVCPYNTKVGAVKLLNYWNKEDPGKWVWRVEECLPTDFDHPNQVTDSE